MNAALQIQELAVVVVAKNHNPTILNPDFLKYNGIVSPDWELARPPICTEPVAEVRYRNGINIIAQLQKLIFSQTLADRSIDEAQVPEIMVKYIETLPHVDYRATGINVVGHVSTDTEEEAQKYILDNLIAQGPWKKVKNQQPNVSVSFSYPIEQGSLNITVEKALLPLSDQKHLPVVAFRSNFHREIPEGIAREKVAKLMNIIQSWKKDIVTFQSLVEGTFLFKEGSHAF
jgi:hypothetical protein